MIVITGAAGHLGNNLMRLLLSQGEEVRAIIVPDLEQFQLELNLDTKNPEIDKIEPFIKEAVNEVNRRVADYKRVSGFELRMEELEKTSTRKIKRFLYR